VLRAFVATSLTPVLLVRLSPIEPAFVPVVPVVLTDTVQVADGAPPEAVAELIVGAVPPVPLVAKPKFEVDTPFTGSLNVTVHVSGPLLTTLLPPARLIDDTVGAVVSYV